MNIHLFSLKSVTNPKIFSHRTCSIGFTFYFYAGHYWIPILLRNTKMKLLGRTISLLKNKFLLASTAFVVWMLFFDRNDVFTQMQRKSELNELKESKTYFEKQITENKKFSKDLQFNASAIEKYAREKYLMKRDNEDLFIIQPLEKK